VCRTPCGFSGTSAILAPGDALTLYAITGHVSAIAIIEGERGRLAQPAYVAAKRAEAQALTERLTNPIATQTSNPDSTLTAGKPCWTTSCAAAGPWS